LNGEGILSGRKDLLLPVHFTRQREVAPCFLGSGQSRLKVEYAQHQKTGICEFANGSHGISFSCPESTRTVTNTRAWAQIDVENDEVSRFAPQRTRLASKRNLSKPATRRIQRYFDYERHHRFLSNEKKWLVSSIKLIHYQPSSPAPDCGPLAGWPPLPYPSAL
jgi:hypothetical protein